MLLPLCYKPPHIPSKGRNPRALALTMLSSAVGRGHRLKLLAAEGADTHTFQGPQAQRTLFQTHYQLNVSSTLNDDWTWN